PPGPGGDRGPLHPRCGRQRHQPQLGAQVAYSGSAQVSYLPALFGTVAAYVLLAILLLSLNIVSRWRFWVKAGAILVTTLAFFGTYFAITGLLGWPSAQSLPARFSLLSTRIIEPDKATGAPGRLFMWVEEIDEENQPSADPRNHEVAYTTELAEKLY